MREKHSLIWLLIWILTLIVSLFANTALFTLGLILIEFLAYPLALVITALLAALIACGLANLLIKDNLKTDVQPVVIRCEAAAVILSLLVIAGIGLGLLLVLPIFISLTTAVILSLAAVFFASRLRRPPLTFPNRRRRVILWLVLAFALIPITVWLASLVGWAGA